MYLINEYLKQKNSKIDSDIFDQLQHFDTIQEKWDYMKKINSLEDLSHNDILKIFDEIEFKLQENSLRTLSKRLISYL